MTIKAKCIAPDGYECGIEYFAYPPQLDEQVKCSYNNENTTLNIKSITHDIHQMNGEPYIIVELYKKKEIV